MGRIEDMALAHCASRRWAAARAGRVVRAALACLLVPAVVSAGSIRISAECEGSTMTVELFVSDPGGLPELVGFDIYRAEVGPCDASSIRITDSPLPRPVGTSATQTITDEDLAVDTAYLYQVLPVDVDREVAHGAYNDDHYDGWESSWIDVSACGRGVIAHGLVDSGWPGFADCEFTCYLQSLAIDGDEFGVLEEYYDTGTHVYLYGDVWCGWEGCFIYVTDVEPSVCEDILPPRESTWAHVKALFQ